VSKLHEVIGKNQDVKEDEVKMEWTPEEKLSLPPRYGCQILLEKTTVEQAKDPSFPNDAYLIWYTVDGQTYIDLCRTSKRSNLFDLYYDKFGPGAVQKIDFGYGRTNPKIWGYKSPEKKKRK
jgi:hypothetical protein